MLAALRGLSQGGGGEGGFICLCTQVNHVITDAGSRKRDAILPFLVGFVRARR